MKTLFAIVLVSFASTMAQAATFKNPSVTYSRLHIGTFNALQFQHKVTQPAIVSTVANAQAFCTFMGFSTAQLVSEKSCNEIGTPEVAVALHANGSIKTIEKKKSYIQNHYACITELNCD